MRSVVKIAVGLMIVLIPGGLWLTFNARVREAAQRTQCLNNLRLIGLTIENYHGAYTFFPTGTIANKDLPPDQRLSWAVDILPFLEGGVLYPFDQTKSWDAAENCPPRERRAINKEQNLFSDELIGDLRFFLCPANPARNGPDMPCPLHYPGIAGQGESAAELPLSDPRVGFFGYDRTINEHDIKDGLATTLMVVESADGGPFTAGGMATIRGLVPDRPYIGVDGQFTSQHRDHGDLRTRPIVTNVGFADGHAGSLTSHISPTIFEGLATIAGGEDVGSGEAW
jgi:prepilin-type processing-associated H-X9-DG protein